MNATAHHTGIIKVRSSKGIRNPKDYMKALGKDVVLEKTNEQNTVAGVCSAILGGSGNTISAAYNHAGIFGCNVAAVAGNTFHVNCLNACDTPGSGTYPSGTIYYKSCTAITASDRVLVITP